MNCETKNVYIIKGIKELSNKNLIDYLAEYGIPFSTALKYLHQIKLYNRKERKHFVTIGMLNEDEGYELRSSEMSGFIDSERDVSFIRGLQLVPSGLHVFYDLMDFLLVASRQPDEAFMGDAIILHTFDLLYKVPPYVYQYDYRWLYSWMPNTDTGNMARTKLSAICATEPLLRHRPQNNLYAGSKTVDAYYARRPGPITFN